MNNALGFIGIVGTHDYTIGTEKRRAEVRKQPNGAYAFEIFIVHGDGFEDVSLYQSVKNLTKRDALRLLNDRREIRQ